MAILRSGKIEFTDLLTPKVIRREKSRLPVKEGGLRISIVQDDLKV